MQDTRPPEPSGIAKCPTGIAGFDEISLGGLPRGRPTLLVGSAGSGKTLFASQFLVNGINCDDEAGVFVSFEESVDELAANLGSLAIDLRAFEAAGRLALRSVPLSPCSVTGAGEFDLEPLFIRIGAAIDAVAAKRVVLDGIANLFAILPSEHILRTELQRLFIWLKDRGVTAIVTGERGIDSISRHGFEEYISDCVVLLDHRVNHQIATRRLRIVKYRGSAHGADEYPFLLGDEGFVVMPISSAGLDSMASEERISTGVPSLNAMLGGEGFFRGSSILISGTSGTGKSTLAAHVIAATCRRGEPCLYVAMEESPSQIVRNMRSVGIDLQPWIDAGLLHFHATRAQSCGLETHLAIMHRLMLAATPRLVVIDPISAFEVGAETHEVKTLLIRSLDLFKQAGITTLVTSLTHDGDATSQTYRDAGMSSLMDTWLFVRNLEQAGERTRTLYVMKSRGMAHSNQVREFIMTASGIELIDVHVDQAGQLLTGSARALQEALEQSSEKISAEKETHRQALIQRKRALMEARINALRAEFEDEMFALEADVSAEAADKAAKAQALNAASTRRSDKSDKGDPK
ncbi:KaiC family protein [Thiorhodococcus mannitoliphagus]|uniref:non-specific serine/threonine protein kinase n=1 Tax=Thiorhodococcus mannitoliphagus TaxID=329406 RepID=A0A6P1DU02_9GAMM|nr:circadian clock protein KaiC [Thiorhodococcus mannitoliphagus]NEX19522.1 KaiC family protein [Thiorhodococcus mannitoliphagus]